MIRNHLLVLIYFFSVNILCTKAQTGNESSILPLLIDGEIASKNLIAEYNTIARFEIDSVNQSSARLTPVKLISGRTYTLVLVGEFKVIEEIELKIYSYQNRTMVLKNEISESKRIIRTTFKPDKTDYEFEISAKKFSTQKKAGRYCLIIAYQ